MTKVIVIVGSGLVGSLAALILGNRKSEDYKILVYELRQDIRNVKDQRGRSINLALSVRGLAALTKAGVADKVKDLMIPMRGRMLHNYDGDLTEVPYGSFGEAINSVDRKKLNELLLNEASKNPNVELYFEHALEAADLDTGRLNFRNKKTGELVHVESDLIIGADGVHSVMRKELMRRKRINFSQEYISHGYMELTIDGNTIGNDLSTTEYAMSPNHLHIWPRHSFMMIALPNLDKSFTTTLFMPYENFDEITSSSAKMASETRIIEFFKENFPDSIELLGGTDNLVRQVQENPVGPLVSIKCSNYNYKDKAVIIGDANHAMVPFYGQGMNAGFEDCLVLDAFIHGEALPKQLAFNTPKNLLPDESLSLRSSLDRFSEYRHPDAVSICDLAMYNYIEMRHGVLSFGYRVRKVVEGKLHRLFPTRVIPLYTMVSFSQIRYSEVVKKWNRQTKWLQFGLGLSGMSVLASIGLLLLKRR